MGNEELDYTMKPKDWKEYLLTSARKYVKELKLKDLNRKIAFKHKEKIKPGLYVFNTSYLNTTKALGPKANFWDKITFAYVLNFNDFDDYEILNLNVYSLSSNKLKKENANNLSFLKEIIKKSGHIDYMYFIHIPLIYQEINMVKDKHTGYIDSFYKKFWQEIKNDPTGIMGSKIKLLFSPLGVKNPYKKYTIKDYELSHLIGKNTKDLIAKNVSLKQSLKRWDFNNLYIANTNSWKFLEGRNIVYENKFINWNESYNLNN